jgi:hypothetical protein
MFSGTFLLIFGVGTIIFQMSHDTATVPGGPPQQIMQQQMVASPEGFKATTHYVGVELVMVGAALQIAGFLGSAISKRSRETPNEN